MGDLGRDCRVKAAQSTMHALDPFSVLLRGFLSPSEIRAYHETIGHRLKKRGPVLKFNYKNYANLCNMSARTSNILFK